MNIPAGTMPTIVVIGGGFAGLHLIKELLNTSFRVVLIDKHNYHCFQPLLYQVATAGLEPDSIAYPLRRTIQAGGNVYYRMAEVEQIHPENNSIETNIGSLHYDYLVIATGSKTNYFGNKNIEKMSYPMKTIPEALNLRSLILQSFEKALIAETEQEKLSLMNFVIVGAGPTGVELAGALAELKRNALPVDYPDLDIDKMQISLIEGIDRVLGPMSPVASSKALEYLQKLGVHVMLNTKVNDYDGRVLTYNDTETMEVSTLIWTAGVTGAVIAGIDATRINRGGRIKVDAFNKVDGYQNIYAIGDISDMSSESLPRGYPMVAQVAIQQGSNLGKNFIRLSQKKDLHRFEYKDLGSMATVGKNKAVVDLPFVRFQGFFAWFVWMFVHLLALVGFRNKVVTFMNWAYNYVKYDKGIRLIIRPVKSKLES